MARPRIPNDTIKQIKGIWASDPTQSAPEVYRKFRQQKRDHDVGIRRVQQIVAEAKKGMREGEPFPMNEWLLWRNEQETPEDINYLVELSRIALL